MLFNFQTWCASLLLVVCGLTYFRLIFKIPSENSDDLMGLLWKMSRVGERASPLVAVCCLAMAAVLLFSPAP